MFFSYSHFSRNVAIFGLPALAVSIALVGCGGKNSGAPPSPGTGATTAGASGNTMGTPTIPQMLREMGKLNETVLLIGCFNHLEIWDTEEYKQYCEYPDTYGKKRREAMQRAYGVMRG